LSVTESQSTCSNKLRIGASLPVSIFSPARQLLAELTEQARIAYVPAEYLERLAQALAR